MAELAAVGIAASILQVIDFGTRVLKRLEEYQSYLGEIPEGFRHIKAQQELLLDALRQTEAAIKTGALANETKVALLPAVQGCVQQIQFLDGILKKTLPTADDSWFKRARKAFESVLNDQKIEKSRKVIDGYISVLVYHHTASNLSKPLKDRSVPSPTAQSNVPFRRDPNFVDRSILSIMHQKSQFPGSRVALVGLGGVGKSQLAVEYSYQNQKTSPSTWVFWLHAESQSRFVEDYLKIATIVGIQKLNQPDLNTMDLIYGWLSNRANSWLIIVDNADDLDVFPRGASSGSGRPLLELLPPSPNGSLLITSRSRDVALRIAANPEEIIRVAPMNEDESLCLLRNRLGDTEDYKERDAIELVAELDYMPLAISQAGGYIRRRQPRTSVSKYLKEIRDDTGRAQLLTMDLDDSRRDGTASNSILNTWQLSFNYIRTKNRSATILLSAMSLFDRQGIPDFLFRCDYKRRSGDSNSESNHDHQTGELRAIPDFDDDLDILTSFSLISIGRSGDQYSMHRLVQFATRKWLEKQGELEKFKEWYIWTLVDHFPDSMVELELAKVLFPHVQSMLSYRPTNSKLLDAWAVVVHRAASFSRHVFNYSKAAELARLAVDAREAALGSEHQCTLDSLHNLGRILRDNLEEKENVLRKAKDGFEKTLGLYDTKTLQSTNHLAAVLVEQGKDDEGLELSRTALGDSESHWGPDAIPTLHCLLALAWILLNGNWDRIKEAEALGRRALEGYEKYLDPDDERIGETMVVIGVSLMDQGRFGEAKEMMLKVVDKIGEIWGPEHPSTTGLKTISSQLLMLLDDDEEALSLTEHCVEVLGRTIGYNHEMKKENESRLEKWRDPERRAEWKRRAK